MLNMAGGLSERTEIRSGRAEIDSEKAEISNERAELPGDDGSGSSSGGQ
jgi:hypothetical protein